MRELGGPYGWWTIIARVGKDHVGHTLVTARCRCGTTYVRQLSTLRFEHNHGRVPKCPACSWRERDTAKVKANVERKLAQASSGNRG